MVTLRSPLVSPHAWATLLLFACGAGCTLLADGELADKPAFGAGGDDAGAVTGVETTTAGTGGESTASGSSTGSTSSTSHSSSTSSSSSSSSSSGIPCPPHMGNCDGNILNGCEVDLNSSPTNCGACGNVCTGAPPRCMGGKCM